MFVSACSRIAVNSASCASRFVSLRTFVFLSVGQAQQALDHVVAREPVGPDLPHEHFGVVVPPPGGQDPLDVVEHRRRRVAVVVHLLEQQVEDGVPDVERVLQLLQDALRDVELRLVGHRCTPLGQRAPAGSGSRAPSSAASSSYSPSSSSSSGSSSSSSKSSSSSSYSAASSYSSSPSSDGSSDSSSADWSSAVSSGCWSSG